MDAEAGSEKSSEAGSSCVTGDAASSEDDNLSLGTTSSSDGSTLSTSTEQDSASSTSKDTSLPVTHARSLRRVPESLDLGDAQKSEYHDAETMGGVFTPEPRTPRSPGEWSWYTGTFTDDPDDAVTKAFKEGYKSKDKKKWVRDRRTGSLKAFAGKNITIHIKKHGDVVERTGVKKSCVEMRFGGVLVLWV
jgi:hypothetical protein